jgi:hypothetical protein
LTAQLVGIVVPESRQQDRVVFGFPKKPLKTFKGRMVTLRTEESFDDEVEDHSRRLFVAGTVQPKDLKQSFGVGRKWGFEPVHPMEEKTQMFGAAQGVLYQVVKSLCQLFRWLFG